MGLIGSAISALATPVKKTAGAMLSGNTMARTAAWTGVGAATGFITSESNNPTNRFYDALRGAGIGMGASLGVTAGAKAGKWAVNTKGIKQAYNLKNQVGPRMASGAFSMGGAPAGSYGPLLKGGHFTRASQEAASYTAQISKSPIAAMGRGAIGMGKKVGSFAFNHPVGLAAGVGVVGGATLLANTSPASPTMSGAEVNTRYDQQAIAAMEMQTGTGAAGMGLGGAGRFGSAPEMMGHFHRAHQASTAGLVQGLHRGRHG